MSNISIGTRQLLNFSMLENIGQKIIYRILMLDNLPALDHEQIASRIPELASAVNDSRWNKACEFAEYQINQSEKLGVRILSPLDDEYPILLRQSIDDPCLLWVQGILPSSDNCVAIIGPREPTSHGEIITARITKFFVNQGWSIVSGLALGCDTIAHESTLESGGHTVAVMAHGLHMVSPASNKKLSERIIASGGALISEFPLGKKAEAHRFVRRDRTQAALSQGVVMVQSDLRGGSLHAPRAALYYKRWVAIPYPTLKDRKSKAFKILANLLIADGEAKDKMNLLGCNLEALSLIIILNSRDDYPLLLSAQIRNKPNNYPFQEPLI